MADFGPWLAQELAARGWSGARFARRVGVSQSWLSKVLRGERRPPREGLRRWADALGLDETGRRTLLELAELAHAPEAVRERLASVEAALAACRRRYEAIEGYARRLAESSGVAYEPELPGRRPKG